MLKLMLSFGIILTVLLQTVNIAFSQDELLNSNQLDTLQKAKDILKDAKVESSKREIEITVRSVDISNFPMIKIMIEAYNKLGNPLDSLNSDNLFVFENGIEKKVLSVEKIPAAENVPVDFVFLIDITGSMQPQINSVKSNISNFTQSLMKRGIDYRIGLILFTDDIEKVYNPTANVLDFLAWINPVRAKGGGDEKENALEAIEAACKQIKWRKEANRVAVLITDAPYHQKGEDGHGVTDQTTESSIELMQQHDLRLFSIVPPKLTSYKLMASKTRGTFYDIDYPFSTILDNFSNQLTNLFNLIYKSDEETVPDSIEIALFSTEKRQLVKKTIPIVELGRKLIIENLLFQTASANLPGAVRELDILADFMQAKPNIEIMIEGHTDAIGSHEVNDALSIRRAESVKAYLVKYGIEARRVSTTGFGKRKPLASNNNEFGRRLNRRTEIIIVAK
ncbi:MAG: OmpA family protein [Candidatus Kapabacteria bacterium]|nr:OmpA family protein [Ignavibacteriota bacterium]MCW5885394.1 OmpA family protein [Candidatus Kapabacteria bacterium]